MYTEKPKNTSSLRVLAFPVGQVMGEMMRHKIPRDNNFFV
jgi:hypothetical protein